MALLLASLAMAHMGIWSLTKWRSNWREAALLIGSTPPAQATHMLASYATRVLQTSARNRASVPCSSWLQRLGPKRDAVSFPNLLPIASLTQKTNRHR